MKTNTFALFALIVPTLSHEQQVGNERRLGFGGKKDPAAIQAKYLSIYQRCCLPTEETLKSKDLTTCRCPVRTYQGFVFDIKSKWDYKCDTSIAEKADVDAFDLRKESIVDIVSGDEPADGASEAGNPFSTLLELVAHAGLVDALSLGPLTVFAPTNEAFADLGTLDDLKANPSLANILTYHVIAGNIPASTLSNGSVETLSGKSVKIDLSGGGVKVNDSQVTQANVLATNGVIHVIDKVLVPPS